MALFSLLPEPSYVITLLFYLICALLWAKQHLISILLPLCPFLVLVFASQGLSGQTYCVSPWLFWPMSRDLCELSNK